MNGANRGTLTESLIRAIEGNPPAWLERFLSQMGRGMHRHRMIRPGDRVLVGVSGGKDSLSTVLGLALRRRKLPFKLDLAAAMVSFSSFPADSADIGKIEHFLGQMGIAFVLLQADPSACLGDRSIDCYACARIRKQLIFEYALEQGYGTVAFGQHLDDFAATALMNLSFRGKIEPMAPVRSFFDGKIRLIRPLCEIRESSIRRLAQRLELPVLSVDCPMKHDNLRVRLKPIFAELAKMNTLVPENMYRAYFGPKRGKAFEEDRWKSGI